MPCPGLKRCGGMDAGSSDFTFSQDTDVLWNLGHGMASLRLPELWHNNIFQPDRSLRLLAKRNLELVKIVQSMSCNPPGLVVVLTHFSY
jgi:hypothetical protein